MHRVYLQYLKSTFLCWPPSMVVIASQRTINHITTPSLGIIEQWSHFCLSFRLFPANIWTQPGNSARPRIATSCSMLQWMPSLPWTLPGATLSKPFETHVLSGTVPAWPISPSISTSLNRYWSYEICVCFPWESWNSGNWASWKKDWLFQT